MALPRFLTAPLLCLLSLPISATRPVKVFILAGQSNMVGQGSLKHLNILVNRRGRCNEFRGALWNETSGDYKERDDVYIKYGDSAGRLAPGRGYAGRHCFGPELMFGWTVGDAYPDATVYLIKLAYSGKSLAVDFRPPSSGEGDYPDVKPHEYGWVYRQMISDYFDAIDSMADVIPDYDRDAGYEISGFVWFQGYHDFQFWPMVREYGVNLGNFIRDVRLDLDIPGLPVIVGELGMHGLSPSTRRDPDTTERVVWMRAAERSVTGLPEFRENTQFVPTAPFAVLNGTKYNRILHYYGRADTYFHIGEAFGKGIIELIESEGGRSN